MELKEVGNIVVEEDRQRKLIMDLDLNALADSIERLGLFHAPVLKADGKTLNSGERRYRAICKLHEENRVFTYDGVAIPHGTLPTIVAKQDTEIGYLEAEYEENAQRLNLTWQEDAEARAKLHRLRALQKAERGEEQTIKDTAKELAEQDTEEAKSRKHHERLVEQDVKMDLLVIDHMDDPEVRKAPTRNDAIKIIKKKLEDAHRAKLAEDYILEHVDSPHTVINGDMLDKVPLLEAGTFDCIIADPPYGIDADKFKNQAAVKHTYKDSKEYADAIMRFIALQGMRITKPQAHLYLFCDIMRFQEIAAVFEAAGWYVWRTPLIWNKGPNAGILPRVEHGPRRTYEAILYAIKGDKKTKTVAADVISIGPDKSVQRGAHKPPDLYVNLIRRSCNPGDKIIDPCCGVGPIITAARITNTIATGIEIDPVAYTVAVERQTGEIKEEPTVEELMGEEDNG